MDLNILNEFLAPYQIEISCVSCLMNQEKNYLSQKNNRDNYFPLEKIKTENKNCQKKEKQKNMVRKWKKETTAHKLENNEYHNSQTPQTMVNKINSSKIRAKKMPDFWNSCLIYNQPNNFLNLKVKAFEFEKPKGMNELLETHRNTPIEIEHVEFDHMFRSGNKKQDSKHDFAKKTAETMLVCPVESPMSFDMMSKTSKTGRFFNDGFALGEAPSRDLSPFQTPYRKNQDTPSYRDKTPKCQTQFTPNAKRNDNLEEYKFENFDLFENPFQNRF